MQEMMATQFPHVRPSMPTAFGGQNEERAAASPTTCSEFCIENCTLFINKQLYGKHEQSLLPVLFQSGFSILGTITVIWHNSVPLAITFFTLDFPLVFFGNNFRKNRAQMLELGGSRFDNRNDWRDRTEV
jgi:hypothetical protein